MADPLLAVALDDAEKELEDDDDIAIIAIVSAFMRRNLHRSKNFFEVTVPRYHADEFQSHFRLTRTTAENLTREIVGTGLVSNEHSFGRKAIPSEKQVLLYLWMMANGRETTRQVADRFDVTMSSCGRVLRRLTSALVTLRQQYIKWPNVTEMRDIAAHFEDGGLPGVIGVIDGTFVQIRAPCVDPIAYNCRKKFHALQLQMVCDNNMILTDVLAGWPGSVHDSRVLRNSLLHATAVNKFPHDYHLLGDQGYPLLRWLMVPFRNNGHLQRNQTHFNSVLSSNRQVVERAISLLKGRWRKLKYLDHLDVMLMVQIIVAACVLHNFCLINDDFDDMYFLDENDDNGDDNDVPIDPLRINREAEQKRQHLVNVVAGNRH